MYTVANSSNFELPIIFRAIDINNALVSLFGSQQHP